MFKRSNSKYDSSQDSPAVHTDKARGGVSFWSILTGVVVAFGGFIVLSAIVSGVLVAVGALEGSISAAEVADAGIAVAVGFVIAQFLSYLWGGYTAGRMARGKGLLNGLLVPIVAIVLVVLLGAILTFVADSAASTAAQNANVSADTPQIPLPLGRLADIGTAAGIGLLIAMLLGGIFGGMLGERWHTKLERSREEELRREAALSSRDRSPAPPESRERTETSSSSETTEAAHRDSDRDGVPDSQDSDDAGSRARKT